MPGPKRGRSLAPSVHSPAEVRIDIRAQDGMRDALDQDDAACLWINRVAAHASATAGIAEGCGIVGLVGQLEATAIKGDQAPTGLKRLRVQSSISQRLTTAPHELGQWFCVNPSA